MLFILCEKLLSFLRYLNFVVIFWLYVEKRPDKKSKLKFKIFDVADWIANNFNTYIVRYIKQKEQPDNEILRS